MSLTPTSKVLKFARPGKCAFIISFAILPALYLAILISRAAVDVPFKDELYFPNIYASVASGKFLAIHNLIAAHNGHPYLLLKLLMIFTLSNGLPWSWMMYAQVPILLAAFLIANKLLTNDYWSNWIATVALAFAIITPRQWENLYWGMQIAFSLSLLLGLCAFYCLQRYSEKKLSSWLTGALVISSLASVCSAQGFLAFLITLFGLTLVKPSRNHFVALLSCGLAGTALFAASEMLAMHAGAGRFTAGAVTYGEHVARMFGNAIAYYGRHIGVGILIGVAVAALAAYCSWIALKRYRQFMFELACIAWGVGLILVVSYARLAIDINQPNAPRYVPLVMPILIGIISILAKTRRHAILAAIMVVVLFGYFQSAASEWHITPYRKANLTALSRQLCSASDDYGKLSVSDLRNLQYFFCSSNRAKW